MTRAKAAALDTNLLLLHLVDKTDLSLLRSFKRVGSFREEDADLLSSLLRSFSTLISTPHVLSEACNFLEQAPQHRRPELMETFAAFVQANDEWWESAKALCQLPAFALVGLSDTGLYSLSRTATIITMDWRLAGKIHADGGNVVNFNHLRVTTDDLAR